MKKSDLRADSFGNSAPGLVPPIAESLVAARGDSSAMRKVMSSALQEMGFSSFVFSRRNRLQTNIGSRWSCWGDFPDEWAKLSRARGFSTVEPIRRATYRNALPLLWDQNRFATEERSREYFAAAATFEICSGVSIVVSTTAKSSVDFFDVYAPVKVIATAHRRGILERMSDLWVLGTYGHAMLPDNALVLPTRDRVLRGPPGGRHRLATRNSLR